MEELPEKNGISAEGVDGAGQGQNTQSTSLVIVNNRVVLPRTRAVALESRKFHALLRRAVPSVAPELIEALKARQDRPSRLSRLGLFVGLLAVFAVVLLLWPRTTPLKDTSLTYEIATQTGAGVEDRYRRLLAECDRLMAQEEYTVCAARLKEPVAEILEEEALFRANARLLSIYLVCNQKSMSLFRPDGICPEMVRCCRKARTYSDSPEWRVYELYFLWARYKWRCDAFRRGDTRGLRDKAIRRMLEAQLRELDREAASADTALAQRGDAADFRETLDQIRCEILMARWLVEGYSAYPNDFGDQGVAFREEAYRIAKRYDDNRAFLEMRKDIANLILDKLHWYNDTYYYFDGRRYWKAEHLEKTIEEIRARIETLGDNGSRGGKG